jgi:hypothetical protein
MKRSYLGLATPNGLEALYQENDHVVRFLHRRIYRPRALAAICYWAVLEDRFARLIEFQISIGEFAQAWYTLQYCAIDAGVSLPLPKENFAIA